MAVTHPFMHEDEILTIKDLSLSFPGYHGYTQVLHNVSFSVKKGETLAIVGESGSGKTVTMRRVMQLLANVRTDSGRILLRKRDGTVLDITNISHKDATKIRGADLSMIFQEPMTSLNPVFTIGDQLLEAVLIHQRISKAQAMQKVMELLELVRIPDKARRVNDYPFQLSGGMRQRVGFARALVVDPTLLLMDEPFSALDVLTAETLRTDLLELWTQGRMPIRSILIVTHNIEEAVFMCDRILVLSSNPGRVVAEIRVPFAHPRNRLDPAFRSLVDEIYSRMTTRYSGEAPKKGLDLGSSLPQVSTNLMAGLIETLAAEPYFGKADMPEIARSLQLEVDELFPVAEMLQHLGFAEVHAGDIKLTVPGRIFSEGSTQERKVLFAEYLLQSVPLAAHIRQVLNERPGHHAPRVRFEQELEDFLTDATAEETLESVINWGRYAEIFSYNDQTEFFSLEDVES